MTNGIFTSTEQPFSNKVDDDNFWDNHEISVDEEEALVPPQEATQFPPPQPRNM